MSDLIDYLRANPDTNNKPNRQKETYNTLYFRGKIDVRLCPKNACSTLKHLYRVLYAGEDHIFHSDRTPQNVSRASRRDRFNALRGKNLIDLSAVYLFRRDSIKIAIVRDPVERALSAVKYLYEDQLGVPTPTLDQIIDTLNNITKWDNSHLYTQTWYMGKKDQYDHIFTINQMRDCVDFIVKKQDAVPDLTKFQRHVNVSTSDITIDDLPLDTIRYLQKVYKEDYDNGWYINEPI